MKSKVYMAALGLLVLSIASCVKQPANNLTEDESRIFITNRDSTVNFSAFKTVAVTDSVSVIQNNQLVERSSAGFDQQLLAAFKSNLQAAGYTVIDKASSPDLLLNVSRVYNDYTGLISYNDYYGGYGGYYDPYYWGYTGYSYAYPAFYGTYTITEGGISADLIDARDAGTTNQLKIVWNGLIRGAGTFNQSKIDANVKALFDQSTYLKTTE